MAVIGFCSGLRAEVLIRIRWDAFRPGVTGEGHPMMTLTVGTMKNLPANLAIVLHGSERHSGIFV